MEPAQSCGVVYRWLLMWAEIPDVGNRAPAVQGRGLLAWAASRSAALCQGHRFDSNNLLLHVSPLGSEFSILPLPYPEGLSPDPALQRRGAVFQEANLEES